MTAIQETSAVDTVNKRFLQGWEDTHLEIAAQANFNPFAEYEVVIAGLRNCGIGGFNCNHCNESVLASDPTAMDYVNGVAQALSDRGNGAVL